MSENNTESTSFSKEQMTGCLTSFFSVFIFTPIAAYAAAILEKVYWNWFIATPFHISTISLAQTFGISCIISAFRYKYPNEISKNNSIKELTKLVNFRMVSLFATMCTLGVVGYLAHYFMLRGF
jgi:hypothetical protein